MMKSTSNEGRERVSSSSSGSGRSVTSRSRGYGPMNEDVSFELAARRRRPVRQHQCRGGDDTGTGRRRARSRRGGRCSRLSSSVTHVASALGRLRLDVVAALLRPTSVDARLAGGAVVAAAALTATMYTFYIALHTVIRRSAIE